MEIHLPTLVGSVTRTARAWRNVSMEGGSRVASVGSGLLTLSAERWCGKTAAVGALGAVASEVGESLRWLRRSVARLSRMEITASDAVKALRTLAPEEHVTWSLTASVWANLFDAVAQGMQSDLIDKREAVAELECAIRGGGVDGSRIEILAALWLEQPALRELDVEILAAVLEAEAEAQRLAQVQTAFSTPPREVRAVVEARSRGRQGDDLSPAMAFLLGGGKRK